jgi:hypothetical protein
MNISELELRYGDCTVKKLTGGFLSGAMRNLIKFRYAGTPLGTIRVTGQFGRPVGEIEYTRDSDCWSFTPEGESTYPPRYSASELMSDIKELLARENNE